MAFNSAFVGGLEKWFVVDAELPVVEFTNLIRVNLALALLGTARFWKDLSKSQRLLLSKHAPMH